MVASVAAPLAENLEAGRPKRRGLRDRLRRDWMLLALCVPGVLYFVLFFYIPLAGNVIAFKDYSPVKGPWGSPWVGFRNFELFFQNPVFWTLVKNTFLLSVYTVLASFPIPNLPICLRLACHPASRLWLVPTCQRSLRSAATAPPSGGRAPPR